MTSIKSKSIFNRRKHMASLVLSVNYFSSISILCLVPIMYYVLEVKVVIPHIFLAYGITALMNILLFYRHKNIHLTYVIACFLGLLGSLFVSIYSGGIE
ncbi:hypothetical protein OOZ15_09720 [Galbibacter sp. EGI 63066]|uniref:hypothetical protein n=1 Tax=Galbibacter sp. EGI 63066 TaxID=2993559 RepID=UPI002248B3B1|nr:hypothetical protein [Galbibacter sp. EGI 63066]MCX2680215.1 hypothetical protein [Galbibacter sp. EGI 63066]